MNQLLRTFVTAGIFISTLNALGPVQDQIKLQEIKMKNKVLLPSALIAALGGFLFGFDTAAFEIWL